MDEEVAPQDDLAGVEIYDVDQSVLEQQDLVDAGVEVYDVDMAALEGPKPLEGMARFKAGAQRSWYNAKANFSAHQAAGRVSAYKSQRGLIERRAAEQGISPDELLATMDPAVKASLDKYQSEYIEHLADAIQNTKRAQELGDSAAKMRLNQATAVGEEHGLMAELGAINDAVMMDPLGLLGDLAIENSVQLAGTLVSVTVARAFKLGRAGEVAAGGSTSAFNEFGSEYVQLRENGLSHEEAWKKAGIKAGVVGAFDAASFGQTGRAVDKMLKTGFLSKVKQASGAIAVDAAIGAGGEAWSQLLEHNFSQRVPLSDIFAEGFAELVGAPAQMAAQYAGAKADAAGAPPPGAPPGVPPVTPDPLAETVPQETAGEDVFGAEDPAAFTDEVVEPDSVDAALAPEVAEVAPVDAAIAPEVAIEEPLPAGVEEVGAIDVAELEEQDSAIGDPEETAPPLDSTQPPVPVPATEGAGEEIPPAPEEAKTTSVAEQPSPLEGEPAKPKARKPAVEPDSTKDSALEFLNKSGGVNRQALEEDGFDPADLRDHRAGGIRRTFHKNGMDLETAGEKLRDAGYAVTDGEGNVDTRKVSDVIDGELRGQKTYSGNRSQEEFEKLAKQHEEDARAAMAEMPEEHRVTAEDLKDALLEPGDLDLAQLIQTARQYATDDEIDAAGNGVQTDADLAAVLRRLISEGRSSEQPTAQQEPDALQPPPGRAGPEGEATAPARETDLFGADSERQGQLNKANARVERKLGEGRKAPPPEVGGGLFAQATQKEDAAARRAQRTIDVDPQTGEVLPETPANRVVDAMADLNQKSWETVEAFNQWLKNYKPAIEAVAEEPQKKRNLFQRIGDRINASLDKQIRKEMHEVLDDFRAQREKQDAARKAAQAGTEQQDARRKEIDDAANQAATSPQNALPAPSALQREAGNYTKGHVRVHGLDISIENPKGSQRTGQTAKGVKWEATLAAHYGYIRGTVGKDKDHIDVYLGPEPDADTTVFVIDQKTPDGLAFDEHKVLIGFDSRKDAEQAYRDSFDANYRDKVMPKRLATTSFSIDEFKRWLAEGDHQQPAAEFRKVLNISPTKAGQPAEPGVNEDRAQREQQRVEPDRPARDPERVGGEVLPAEPAAADSGDGGTERGARGEGERSADSARVPDDGAATERAARPEPVPSATPDRPELTPGSDFSERSPADSNPGILSEHIPTDAVEAAALQPSDLAGKKAAQAAADKVPVSPGIKNIRATLPFLDPKQQDDVSKAEARFAKPDGYGMLFTNGTGTGKTFTGLGILKRLQREGKTNVLILAPTAKILDDWKQRGALMGIDISILEGVKDAGKGFTATTYANIRENAAIVNRPWDHVLADESHYLMSNMDGQATLELNAFRALTLHPSGAFRRAEMKHPVEAARLTEIAELFERYKQQPPGKERLEAERSRLYSKMDQWRQEEQKYIDANQGKKRPRATFLSATPFAYDKAIDYAEGYLFDYPKEEGKSGYNVAEGRDAFMIQHFGYRMKNNKLTAPEADVNSAVMEMSFHSMLQKAGSLSGRMLEVDADYERKFVMVEDSIGKKMDEGIEYLRNAHDGLFRPLYEQLESSFKYLDRMFLLEAIKARAFVPMIRAELAAGRKVVVFHDFNKGGGFHPFLFAGGNELIVTQKHGTVSLRSLITRFANERPDLVNLDFDALSPIETMRKEFPDALFYSGLEGKKQRLKAVDLFNTDGGKHNLIVVQNKAGREGISLHDTSGKHRRTEINLGMPIEPTAAIQQEGRIYRTGNVSDALFIYGNTGTNFERSTFAKKIAERASTAENLALGEEARGLKDAFIDAFESSAPSHKPSESDGKGGKKSDRSRAISMDPFTRAKSFYFGQQKKTSRTKAAEGVDYYATPEPLGLKMVQWAQPRAKEELLEPSAGHGAIARFFPDNTRNTVVEPSLELASKAALANGSAKMITERFESVPQQTKFDVIVMNPPFGHGGKTAMEHLEKAVNHLRMGGRVVALIPQGPSADARLLALMNGRDDIYMAADIHLPPVTFERAGTQVLTHIVVIDKVPNEFAPQQVTRDYSDSIESINDLFDAIQNAELPPRPKIPEEQRLADSPFLAFRKTEYENDNGDKRYVARPDRHFDGRLQVYKKRAKKLGGYYNSYDPNKGFVFQEAGRRDQFIEDTSGVDPGSLDLSPGPARGDNVLPREAMEKHARSIFEKSNIEAVVVDPKNPPERFREPLARIAAAGHSDAWRGYAFEQDGKRIVLFADGRFRSLNDLERTALHELSHHGLDAMFGTDWHKFAGKLYNSQGRSTFEKEIEDYFPNGEFDSENPVHRARVVNEFIARLAEEVAPESLPNRLRALLDQFLTWVQEMLRKMGWRRTFSKAELRELARKSVKAGLEAEALPTDEQEQMEDALDLHNTQTRQAQRTFMEWVKAGQPLDRIFRTAFTPFGAAYIDQQGVWHLNPKFKRAAGRAADALGRTATKRFTWLHPMAQKAKWVVEDTWGLRLKDRVLHGLVDRYGTPQDFLERERKTESEVRQGLMSAQKLGHQLLETNMSKDEAALLTAALRGDEVTDEAIKAVAEPIIDAIEDLGQQLVEVGGLSRESFERNRRKYHHRSYLRHEQLLGTSKLVQWVDGFNERRRVKLQGDIFKGRGVRFDVPIAKLKAAMPANWWGERFEKGKRDVRLGGTRWRVLDRVKSPDDPAQQSTVEGASGKKDKIVQRIYWPDDQPVPKQYAGYKDRGVFEVRDVTGDKVRLWRDWSNDERKRMGEILDGRYNAVKTYAMMVKDLATLKLYADISKNENWSREAEPPPNADGSPSWADAKEVTWRTRAVGYGNVQWVKVPASKIPGSNTYRYGQLAGKYVQTPIWRDLAELEAMQLPGFWKAMLRQWKLNKTSRSPVTHFNNVMSNFLLMDLIDVRGQDFVQGLKSYAAQDDFYQDAFKHGVFGADSIDSDIRQKILDPLLRELKEEAGPTGRMSWISKLTDLIKRGDEWMRERYQMEDEIFRMGAYMKFLKDGMSPEEAAARARRQFIDYDIRAPWINALRTTVLPFVSYTYRAVPLLAEAVYNRPWKIAKYATMAYVANALAYAITEDDDEEKERRLMDPQYQGMTWLGTPRMIRLPFNSDEGNPAFLDIRRWIPAGDVFDMQGNTVDWLPAWLQVGGPLLLGFELGANINTYKDEPIYKKDVGEFQEQTTAEKAGALAKHAWQGFMPNAPWLPGSYSFENLGDAATGTLDRAYQDIPLGPAMLGALGPKVRYQNTNNNIDRRLTELEIFERRMRTERSRAQKEMARNPGKTERFKERIAEIDDKIAKANQAFRATVDGKPKPSE